MSVDRENQIAKEAAWAVANICCDLKEKYGPYAAKKFTDYLWIELARTSTEQTNVIEWLRSMNGNHLELGMMDPMHNALIRIRVKNLILETKAAWSH